MKKAIAIIFALTIATSINAQTAEPLELASNEQTISPLFWWDLEKLAEIINTTKSAEFAKIPEQYFDIDTYFLGETAHWISFLARGIDRALPFGGFYWAGSFNYRFPKKALDNNPFTRMDINAYLNSKIRIGNYFTIPLFVSLVLANEGWDEDDEGNDITLPNTRNEFFLGSGLVFESQIGIFGVFSGLKIERKKEYVNVYGHKWDYKETARDTYPVYIIPRLNTADYPVVGVLLETVSGFLGIKTTGGISAYSATLVSHSVTVKEQEIKFELYHNSKNYNFEAENRNYGLKVHLLPYWSFDAGFRHYFNILGNSYNYGDTGYGKVILQIPTSQVLHGLYVSFDNNYFPWPKWGYEITTAFGGAAFNFGTTENFNEFSFSLRFYF